MVLSVNSATFVGYLLHKICKTWIGANPFYMITTICSICCYN